MFTELVRAAFGAAPPERLRWALPGDVGVEGLQDFQVSLVFPLVGGGGPRVAWSDQGQATRWQQTLERRWSGQQLDDFLASAPPGCRRMVDTDGDTAVVYLDDLQDHPVATPSGLPRGLGLMCLTLDLPRGQAGAITRHGEAPLELLPAGLSARVRTMLAAGAKGLWGVRWQQGRAVGALWVSESRWRGDAVNTQAMVEGLWQSPAWARSCERARELGMQPYPDAVELLVGGGVDLTLGVVRG